MGIFKKKWKTVWEGPIKFDPVGGDGNHVLQKHVEKGQWKAFFKNDNANVPIELKDLRAMYPEVEKLLKYDYWDVE